MARVSSKDNGAFRNRVVVHIGSIVHWKGANYKCVEWKSCGNCSFFAQQICGMMTCNWGTRDNSDSFKNKHEHVMFIKTE